MYKLQPTVCCGDTTKLQHDYYLNQAGQGLVHFSGGSNQYGHGLLYFSGGEFQRGHGIGTLMSGAINQALPVLRPHLMKIVRGIKRNWLATWRNWVRREPKVGERKFSNGRPPWANLPRDDDKLPNHASVYGLTIAKKGESYPAYRMRLQAEITERLRVE